MDSKRCTRCGVLKPAEDFRLSGKTPTSRRSRCLECERAVDRVRNRERQEEQNAYQRRYRQTPYGKLKACILGQQSMIRRTDDPARIAMLRTQLQRAEAELARFAARHQRGGAS